MQVPTSHSSFIGRRREIATLRRMLRRTRLLTLVGPGGSGKTRLAMELARAMRPNTVVWIDLVPIRDQAHVAAAVQNAAIPGVSSPTLVVLDNCEHVVAAAAEATNALLRVWPSCAVLATSREPLRLNGELLWRVEGLAMPRGDSARDAEGWARSDAVRLFVERARLVRREFAFDVTTARHVAQVCQRLDGVPLAIELAAARLRHFSLATIVDLLERPLMLLAGQEGDPDARHHTLRSTIDWSHELLSHDEQSLFRHLAAFPGGFTIESVAAAHADGPDAAAVATLIAALTDKSLIDLQPTTERYRLLEPIRDYATERLRASGEEEAVIRRLSAYLSRLIDKELPLNGLPRDRESGFRVRAEFFNIAAIMPWLSSSDPRRALSVVIRFARLPWTIPTHLGLVEGWLSELLLRYTFRDETRALGLLAFARIHAEHDPAVAAIAATEGSEIAQELDSRPLIAVARFISAYRQILAGNVERGVVELDEALPVLRDGDGATLARALSLRANARARLGDYAGAEDDVQDSLRAWDQYGDISSAMRAQSFCIASDAAYRRGDLELATARLREAVEALRAADATWVVPFALLAHALALGGQEDDALRLAGFADRLLEEHGLWPDRNFALADRTWLERLERTRDQDARRLRGAGRLMTTNLAVRLALGEARGPLTDRESEVARLVADGLSDRDIAARLVISERTVEVHVRRVREKLGVRSRAQVGRRLVDIPVR